MESPSQSQDGLAENNHSTSSHHHLHGVTSAHDAPLDADFDVEPDLPSLDQVIPKDILKKLKPKDKKRQDVLNGEPLQSLTVITRLKR